jgi:prepilin-type N-terminal cleavage/methylation domain-containing protein
MKKNITKLNTQSGFTLIELMVSLSVFIIIVLAAISSLYSVNNAAKKVESMRNVLDNLNFAVESMSRTIRTGTNLSCSSTPETNCTSGSDAIVLTSTFGSSPQTVSYVFNQSNGSIEKIVSGVTIPITSPEINITRLRFFVDGASTADGKQPGVSIFVEGVAKAGTEYTAPFAVQTYVSQRAVE